jgi:signal transduction histidine kinase
LNFPLRYRIALLTVACLLPVVAVTSVTFVNVASRDLWDGARDDAVSFADTVRRATRHAMLTFDREEVSAILETVASQREVRNVRLYDDRGRFRLPAGRQAPDLDLAGPACTACHPDPRRVALHPGRCVHREGQILRLFASVPSEPACWGPACHAQGSRLAGVLEVEMDESGLAERVRSLSARAVLAAVILLTAAVVPLLLAMRWALRRPLTECLRLVRAVSGGDLTVRSRLRRTDEWGELLGDVDAMAAALATARADLQNLNRDLERQVAERTVDLAAALTAAQESDRMKTEFLAGISHELSTPLQAVIGYADLLLDGIEGELLPAQRADVEVIRRNGQALLRLVENLLELARLEGQQRILCVDRIRLQDVAESVIDAGCRLASGKSLTVSLSLEPGCPPVLGDANALRNVLFHLVENAVRHTEQGQVIVAIRAAEDDQVEVEVSDTGAGIPSEVLEAALRGFAPKGGGGGVSVGLSLARRIAELHGGSLAVESEVGKGTRVRVRLPGAPSAD